MDTRRTLISGVIAGMVSVVFFTIIHDLFISDIWFSFVPMMLAGGACGLCLAWSYGLVFGTPSIRSWVSYNLIYLGVFVLLGIVSLIVFEPITTVAAVLATNEAPDELIMRAVPLSVVFTLVVSLLLGWLYGHAWRHYLAIFVTTTVLIVLLGLNISILGLVDIPVGAVYLIGEFFGLMLALSGVYALAFWVLHEVLLQRPSSSD